jgi:hypothetical protein
MKHLQNRIAESTLVLPVTAIFTLVVWLLSGLVSHGWWLQLLLFAVTTYLTVELSNANALLRIRSRMVSCTFLALSCATCFLFGSLTAIIVQLCITVTTIILFRTYQDQQAPGFTFYAFLFFGISSFFFVKVLYLLPIVWILMATHLQSLSWRSWLASLLGLATPYWLAFAYCMLRQDFTLLSVRGDLQSPTLLSPLSSFSIQTSLPLGRAWVGLLFILAMMLLGMVHLSTHSFEDKIRIRQLYGYFSIMSIVLVLLLFLLPQHFDVLMMLLILHASPIVAHYLTLTHSRATNIIFLLAVAINLLITISSLCLLKGI